MNAIAIFRPYDKNFYTKVFVKDIKRNATPDFARVLAENSQSKTPLDYEYVGVERPDTPSNRYKYTTTVENGKAIYMFGGRKALVRGFAAFKRDYGQFVVKPSSRYLAVFHGKITVAKIKTKRILMIANTSNPPPADVSGRRLIVDLYEHQTAAHGGANMGYYNDLDLDALHRIVWAIPN